MRHVSIPIGYTGRGFQMIAYRPGRFAAGISAVLSLLAAHAHAVWNESIPVSAQTPVPAGATISLTLPGGEVIPGTVTEDEEGQKLLFVLPGDAPSPGTITVASSGGARRYQLPDHAPGDKMVLNLRTYVVAVASAEPVTEEVAGNPADRWSFSVGISATTIRTDYFKSIIADERAALDSLFAEAGATGAAIDAAADDSGTSGVLTFGVKRRLTTRSAIYLDASWGAPITLDAHVNGTAEVSGGTLAARSSGESELQLSTVLFGYERSLFGREHLHWFAGAGYVHARTKDKARSSLAFDGTVFAEETFSGDDKDGAAVGELGVRLGFGGPTPIWQLELAAQRTGDLLAGEPITTARLGVSLWF